MSSQSHMPHCRVLPAGEFNVMIPELRVTLQGVATGEFNGMSSQSHSSHCRMLPLGEFTVTIAEPHYRVQSPDKINVMIVPRCMQGVIIPSAILKIVFRHILLFLLINAVWASTSGGFRIVSNTLVLYLLDN